jgi:hypothetical protein
MITFRPIALKSFALAEHYLVERRERIDEGIEQLT